MAALIDTHLHLGREEFDGDRDAVLERARGAGVHGFLHVGFDRPSIDQALALAEGPAGGFAAAALHPHEAEGWDEAYEARLRELAAGGRIVALGECGLDHFRDLSPRDVQERVFRRQIGLAKELDLPLLFHVRDAYADARRVLQDEGLPPRRGIFHAFAGDAAFARWAVDEGFCLGIGGPLTYPRGNVRAAIAGLPAQALQLETDAPWLPPQPWRGQRNEPAYLRHVAGELAGDLGQPLDRLSELWAERFASLLGVELPAAWLAVDPVACPDPATAD